MWLTTFFACPFFHFITVWRWRRLALLFVSVKEHRILCWRGWWSRKCRSSVAKVSIVICFCKDMWRSWGQERDWNIAAFFFSTLFSPGGALWLLEESEIHLFLFLNGLDPLYLTLGVKEGETDCSAKLVFPSSIVSFRLLVFVDIFEWTTIGRLSQSVLAKLHEIVSRGGVFL